MKVSMRLAAAMVLVTAAVLSGGGQVQAQQTAQQTAKPEPPPIPLKVTISVSRYDGDKRTASLPFVLWVNTGGSASIQMGSDVPVPQTQISQSKEGTSTPVQAVTYRSLGTNLNVSARDLGDGLYKVNVSVQDSQVFRMPATGATQLGPVFQNFRSTNEPILRDGQSVQFAVATDKTSGEVIKIDVTLNLVK